MRCAAPRPVANHHLTPPSPQHASPRNAPNPYDGLLHCRRGVPPSEPAGMRSGVSWHTGGSPPITTDEMKWRPARPSAGCGRAVRAADGSEAVPGLRPPANSFSEISPEPDKRDQRTAKPRRRPLTSLGPLPLLVHSPAQLCALVAWW